MAGEGEGQEREDIGRQRVGWGAYKNKEYRKTFLK